MKKLHLRPDPALGTLSEDDSKKYFSVVGLAIFLFMLASYGSATLFSLLIAKLAPHWFGNPIFENSFSLIAQYGIGLPVALLVLNKLPKDTNPSEGLGFLSAFGGFCVAITFMSLGSSAAEIIDNVFLTFFGKGLTNPVEILTYDTPFLVNLIFVAILAPVIEELVFRKLICDRLLPLGEGYAVFLSAAIFGLIHGNLYQFFYAFLTGILFSYVYVKTGRIRYTITYHVIINFLGGVLLPWAIGRLAPILTEENILRYTEIIQSSDISAIEALSDELSPYMLPALLYSGYEIIFTVLSIAGAMILFKHVFKRKIHFREGLLPPRKEGRIADIFCNGGVAIAIAGFAVIFVLSLI